MITTSSLKFTRMIFDILLYSSYLKISKMHKFIQPLSFSLFEMQNAEYSFFSPHKWFFFTKGSLIGDLVSFVCDLVSLIGEFKFL